MLGAVSNLSRLKWLTMSTAHCSLRQVDAGSDDDRVLFVGLPPTEAAAAALGRLQRQQPLLALSRGYRQRRHSLGVDRQQYDDAAEAAAGGVPSPTWDLHSVAESMRQMHEQGLQPWQLPSVRTCPEPKASPKVCLTLDELRAYQQHYPYSLQQQRQQHHSAAQQELSERQALLLRSSQQQPIGRPSSAGPCYGYQPLLEQQLQLQEELQQQQHRTPGQQQQQARLQPPPMHRRDMTEPWHVGASRWSQPAAAAAAATHWAERRRDMLLPADASSTDDAGSSRASAAAGSVEGDWCRQAQQQQPAAPLDLHAYYTWADKAWPAESKAAASGAAASATKQQALPAYKGQVLPKHLAALVMRQRGLTV